LTADQIDQLAVLLERVIAGLDEAEGGVPRP
jgi:hypothetical protein